jgi:hypothetical protein
MTQRKIETPTYIRKREALLPENYTVETDEVTTTVVYKFNTASGGDPACRGYIGKQSKPIFSYRFKTVEERDEYATKFFEDRMNIHTQKQEYKAAQKRRKEEAFKEIKTGDVFSASWGYEQTNVNFYKLLRLKGKTGTFVEIGSITVDDDVGHECDYRRADVDREIGKPFKARLNGDSFKVNESIRPLRLEDPTQKHYCSWYY